MFGEGIANTTNRIEFTFSNFLLLVFDNIVIFIYSLKINIMCGNFKVTKIII